LPQLFDVCCLGDALMDVVAPCDDAFLEAQELPKGGMTLINAARAVALCDKITPQLQLSGGSTANTAAGIADLGGKAAFLGRVAADALGQLFANDMKISGVHFDHTPAPDGSPTGRCLCLITPDAQRSMATFLGAAAEFASADLKPEVIRAARITYLEGYLFDCAPAQKALREAAEIAHAANRQVAFTLSDTFCVERHRPLLRDLVKHQIDLLFSNELELQALYQTPTLEAAVQMARQDCALVVTTRGAAGSIIATAENILTEQAAPVAQVLDTTGAGDLFAAGFLFALTRNEPYAACAQSGHRAAAQVITHFGARM
jgi:sugar/nucleoside kinase (ribokinase family)